MTERAFVEGCYPVVEKQLLAQHCYDFHLLAPEIATLATPGQFVQVSVPGFFLRRPISICGVDRSAGTIRLVIEQRGAGTRILGELAAGESLAVLGPLGRGFTMLDSSHGEDPPTAVLVGGGIGVPPLLMAAAHYGKHATAFVGFRTAGAVILTEDFKAQQNAITLCTDDGTAGHHGLVTAPLAEHLQQHRPDLIYACGPRPMLQAVAELARQHEIPCELSLEERMACGVGACLGCACSVTEEEKQYYAHVCKDGPVFPAEQVVF